jgi:class 3 adenylate cyclase
VNTAARLASHAGTGEVLVSTDAAVAAGLDADLPRTPLDLRGKQAATDVVTLRVRPEGETG